MLDRDRHRSFSVFIAAVLGCGFLSLLLGKELGWDLANYHFYNPFAFLHSRFTIDYWPASFAHGHFAPTIDFLGYFLIRYFSPTSTVFWLGALHGINFWLIFLIAYHFLEHHPYKLIMALLCTLLGLYGPTVLPGIGAFENDNLMSIFVLGFIFLQCRALAFFPTDPLLLKKNVFWGCLLLGIAIGLKLTAFIFTAGALLAYSLLPIPFNHKIKLGFLGAAGGILGIIFSSGYWMLFSWEQYYNPLFPFFHFFHSKTILKFYYADLLPQNIIETILFPFYFSFSKNPGWGFSDYRYPFVFVLFIMTGSKWFLAWVTGKKIKKLDIQVKWLYLLFIGSYFIWEFSFAVPRYIAPLEMLVPLVIYLLLRPLTKNTFDCLALTFMLFYTIAFMMVPIHMVRTPWYEGSFFNIKFPDFIAKTPKATVLVAYSATLNANPRPLSYLIPFFPPEWRIIGIPFENEKFVLSNEERQKMNALINRKTSNYYLLTMERNMPELYRAAKELGLFAYGKCDYIFDDRQHMTHEKTLICPSIKNGIKI